MKLRVASNRRKPKSPRKVSIPCMSVTGSGSCRHRSRQSRRSPPECVTPPKSPEWRSVCRKDVNEREWLEFDSFESNCALLSQVHQAGSSYPQNIEHFCLVSGSQDSPLLRTVRDFQLSFALIGAPVLE